MKPYQVLHVEDLESDADLVQKLLKAAGVDCLYTVVDNQEEFIDILNHCKPDVILCDHTLPMFNSKLAFALAREKYPDIPFILVTGTVSEEFAVEMIGRGIDDYLLKTNLHRLPVAIMQAFAKRENEAKLKRVQADLLQSELQLRSIFNNSPVGLILLDREGKILEQNNLDKYSNGISSLVRFTRGDNLLACAPLHRQQDLKDKFATVLEGQEVQYEIAYKDDTGALAIFNVLLNPIYSPEGAITGACMSLENITSRKNYERQLIETELFSRSILTAISSPISVVDDDGYILEVNEAWKQFAVNNGPANIRLSGKGSNYVTVCEQAASGGDLLAAQALQGFRQVSDKAIPFFELVYPCHSPAKERWFQLTMTKFAGQSGKVVMKHTDITQLTNASREAAEYKNALTQSSILMITDERGIIKQVNENFCRISQYTEGELVGQSHRMIGSCHHSYAFKKQVLLTIRTGRIWHGEICGLAKDGKSFWMESTIVPALNEKGTPFQYIAINYDISKRKQSDTKIAEVMERYEILSQATSDTIWDWDVVQDRMVYNDGIRKVFGYTETEVTGTGEWWYDKLHPDDIGHVVRTVQECFQQGRKLFQLSFRFRCIDGTYKHIFDRGYVIFDTVGIPVRMIGAMQDITYQATEEIRVAKAIIDAQEQERQLLGAELHDNVNQILTASLLSLGMAQTQQLDAGRQLHFMNTASGYITTAIDETRKLSHKLAPASFAGIALADLFKNLLTGLNRDGQMHIKLDFQLLSEDLFSEAIKTNLYRILQEQSKNIVKYAHARNIEVAVTVSENFVKLRIFDDGDGFDTTEEITGIGLSNIRKRAASLQGKCTLHSAPGMGCELVVELPLGSANGLAIST